MTIPFRLFTYRYAKGAARSGLFVAGRGHDLRGALDAIGAPAGPATLMDLLADWPRAFRQLEQAAQVLAARPDAGWPEEEIDFLPPLLYPNGVYCAGANYTDHVAEMERAFNLPHEPDPHDIGQPPWHFIKTPRHTFAAHRSEITLPAFSAKVDWEAEVGVVVGALARNVPVERAMEHVAGYTIVNDLSARDKLRRPHAAPGSPFEYDFLSQKNFDQSCPIGPWIVPAAFVDGPDNLGIRLWVNDELMQDSSTSKLIFDFAEQLSHLSHRLTLFPGDVIATGTPAGVGLPRNQFLQPGDRVRISVDGLGSLENRMAAPR